MNTVKKTCLRRAGFTLLEVLVVVLIIGLLLGVVGTNVFRALIRGQRGTAEMQIRHFEEAMNEFQMDKRRWPETLEELTEPDPVAGKPYMDSIPLDPWKNEYQYEITPENKPLITSFGADGVPGGEGENADISSETMREEQA